MLYVLCLGCYVMFRCLDLLLAVVCCVLFVVCGLLIVVRCVRCLRCVFDVRCLMSVVWCSVCVACVRRRAVFAVRCSLSVVGRLLFVVRCFGGWPLSLLVGCCVLYVVCLCLLFGVRCALLI